VKIRDEIIKAYTDHGERGLIDFFSRPRSPKTLCWALKHFADKGLARKVLDVVLSNRELTKKRLKSLSSSFGPAYFSRVLLGGKKSKLSFDYLLKIADVVPRNEYFWSSLTHYRKWSGADLLDIGREAKRRGFDAWNLVSRYLNFREFSVEELISLGMEVDREHFWLRMVQSSNLSVNELMFIGEKCTKNNPAVWEAILSLKTKKFSNGQLRVIWDGVVGNEERDSYRLLMALGERLDWKQFSHQEAIRMAKKIKIFSSWVAIAIAEQMDLSGFSIRDLLFLADKAEDRLVRKLIFDEIKVRAD